MIANSFNDFFLLINEEGHQAVDLENLYKSYLNEDTFPNFEFQTVTNEQILKIINNLNTTPRSGPDKIFSVLCKFIKGKISIVYNTYCKSMYDCYNIQKKY